MSESYYFQTEKECVEYINSLSEPQQQEFWDFVEEKTSLVTRCRLRISSIITYRDIMLLKVLVDLHNGGKNA